MIGHLKGREIALEEFGWTGRRAEWIALVCLHSGVFTRAQWCAYLRSHPEHTRRGVRALIEQGLACEDTTPGVGRIGRVCRIFSRPIYRALGAEDIRHRRITSPEVLLRRLLSLDYVLEHPELAWLPTEPEKVRSFEQLGIPRKRLPRRVYRGARGETLRYFALKLPVALEADRAVFVYVDPGHWTDKGLRSWGAAHRGLWEALRRKGRAVQVVAVAREDRALERAETVLRRWANGSGTTTRAGDPAAAREYARIKRAVLTGYKAALDAYGGVTPALKRAIELQEAAQDRSFTLGIDGDSTWLSKRFSGAFFNGG